MTELERAESIARKAHAGQTEESTGDAYICHVERVVALVDSDEAKAVAWLHDVVEDSDVTLADLAHAGISPRVVAAVNLLTRIPPFDYYGYIDRVKASANTLALAVKRADLADHLRPNCPVRLRKRYELAQQMLREDVT